ncbi:MAG: amino acid racemase [Myxococcota bacterium]
MSVDQPKIIGIAGGLGPYAHIEFERLVLAATARRLGRSPNDQDFPEWVVSSLPNTPDRTLALLGQAPSPIPALLRSMQRLASAGADFGVIPCNTAHAFLDSLAERSPIPIVDMIAATLNQVTDRVTTMVDGPATIGLLATTGTYTARVYHDRVAATPGLTLISPLDLPAGEQWQEQLVMTPIYGPLHHGARAGGGIKAGVHTPQIQAALGQAVELLAGAGAALVICGCTEIPLALGREAWKGIPLVDPMEAVAEHVVSIAAGDEWPFS